MATAFQARVQDFAARLQNSPAGTFFRWWLAELRELLPAGLRRRLQHARRRLILRLGEAELALSVHESGSLQELDVFPLDRDARLQQQQLGDLLVERELVEVNRDLLLPSERVLRKWVMLPSAAEGGLRQALTFEMDRQTPFRAEEVYFDHRVVGRDRDAGQLRVELFVTPRAALDRDLERLATRGLAPSGVDVETDGMPSGLNLLPPERRHRMVNRRARVNLWLALAAVLLLAGVMAQSILLRQHQLEEVQAAIDEVRKEAMRVQQVRGQIEDASEAAGFMVARRATAEPLVTVLLEVTRLLPDDTYLDRLMIEGDSVQMQGKSHNAQQLIELVNQSPLFADASFRGPTRLDSRSQREIFDLSATIVVGGGS